MLGEKSWKKPHMYAKLCGNPRTSSGETSEARACMAEELQLPNLVRCGQSAPVIFLCYIFILIPACVSIDTL